MEHKPEEISYIKNFGMMIPKECYKPPKERFFKIYSEFGYWHIKIKKLRYPKLLDRLLRPLCKYGWHRWKGTYRYAGYFIQPIGTPVYGEWPKKEEQHYQCCRCKKTKAIIIKQKIKQ